MASTEQRDTHGQGGDAEEQEGREGGQVASSEDFFPGVHRSSSLVKWLPYCTFYYESYVCPLQRG